MDIDPFERMWEAPVEEKVQASGEEPMPAGQHILQISWKDIVIEEWAKKPSSNPEGSVLKVGLTKPGHKIVYENRRELKNNYGMILVNHNRCSNLNYNYSLDLFNWLSSDEAANHIREYRLNNQNVFYID